MMRNGEIVNKLGALVADMNYIAAIGWWRFEHDNHRMVYIPGDDSSDTIRICIPHFDASDKYDSEFLAAAINEVNREVKYVKVVLLGNGSIAVNYDYLCGTSEDISSVLRHMLKCLSFAADYLKKKLS